MGLLSSSSGATDSARLDSETPQKCSTRLRNVPLTRCCALSQGTAVCCHMARISLGTPGKVNTVKPGCGVQMIPGAVPVGLGNTSAPCGNSACLRLLTPKLRPRARSLASRSASTSGRSSKGTPKQAAKVSVVRSSGVGPKPPVQISSRLRSAASKTASRKRSGLSPTTPWRKWGMPSEASDSASQRALPLRMLPSSSSVPMQRISQPLRGELKIGRWNCFAAEAHFQVPALA